MPFTGIFNVFSVQLKIRIFFSFSLSSLILRTALSGTSFVTDLCGVDVH